MSTPQSSSPFRERTGAQHLVDALVANECELVFGVPGESYLAVLDALVDAPSVRFITCRHEAGAANMAEAHGKLTGRPGVCMVTRGPGATHAAVGVHTAFQDSTPMILLVGQVARGMRDREAFQEVDYRRFFADQAKWVAEIDDAARVPEYMERAFATAMNGRPGPVVLALPEDMLEDAAKAVPAGRVEPARHAPGPQAMSELTERLRRAKTPFLLIGGGGWTAEAVADVRRFAEANGLPTGCSFRSKDYLDNESAVYAGDVGIAPNPALVERLHASDLIIALGPRLGEMTSSGYTLFTREMTRERLVHIHPGAEELGRVYTPAQAVHASIPEAARALSEVLVDASAWSGEAALAHDAYKAFSSPVGVGSGVNLSEAFSWLSSHLPADAIVTNGAGNYAAWLHRFYRHESWRTQLAPTSGAMGYGVPAGIAAKIAEPERIVVSVSGDGCFLMCAQELATAKRYGAGVIFIVVDNGSYGTIRMHQERDYPARVSGTDLTNPDFRAFAESFGVKGFEIDTEADFPDAFIAAEAHEGPSLIVIRGDVEQIAPGKTLSEVRGV
ncbi:MAG: thiamine pyrophosphate-binding protein [Pseudomonadota bacterium]